MNGMTQRCPHCGSVGWQFAHREDPSHPVSLKPQPTLTEEGKTLFFRPSIKWQELIAICSTCREVLPMK